VIQKIVKVIFEARRGINQIFFVFKDEFSKEQIRIFNIFRNFVFEDSVTKFATLVRTNFEYCNDLQASEEDRKNLLAQNQELSDIINSCNGIIHFNNPPVIEEEYINLLSNEEIEENNKSKKERRESRRIILKHLTENCLEVYKLKEELGGVKFNIKANLPVIGILETEYDRNSYYGKTCKIATNWLLSTSIK